MRSLIALGKRPKAWVALAGVFLLGVILMIWPAARSLWQVHRVESIPSASQDAAQAAQMLAQAAVHLPWRKDLWERAGRLAYQGGDIQSAVRHFQRAAKLEVLSPQGYLILGEALKQMGDLPAAITAWQEARDRGATTAETYARLLEAYRQLGDYQAAIADLRAWIEIQPSEAALYYQLGLLLSTQEPEAALAPLTHAAELDPSYVPRAQKLVNHLRTGLLSDDLAYVLFEAGRALGALDEWELAAEAFTQAIHKRPDFADAWAFLGEARQHLQPKGEAVSALSALEKALSLEARSLTANTLMALYWQRQGQYARALDYLRTAATLYPKDPAIQAEMGRTLALQGDLEAAYEAYQKALELAPQDATYYRLLALFSLEHEYHVRQIALPAARQAAILAPNDPQSLDTLGQVLLLLGDLTSAQRFFFHALEVQPDFAAAYLHLGLVYALQGDAQGGLQAWNRVVALAPDSPLAEQARRLMESYFRQP